MSLPNETEVVSSEQLLQYLADLVLTSQDDDSHEKAGDKKAGIMYIFLFFFLSIFVVKNHKFGFHNLFFRKILNSKYIYDIL